MHSFDDMNDDARFGALTKTVFQLNNLLTTERDRLVADLGLTSARWQVLEAVGGNGPLNTASDIARHLQISRQAVQRVLNDLAERKLVQWEADATDHRVRQVKLSEQGSAMLSELALRSAILREKVLQSSLPEIANLLSMATGQFSDREFGGHTIEPKGSVDTPVSWSTHNASASHDSEPRTFETIRGRILEQVREGNLQAGDRLPSERELASSLEVGRPAVREALRSLEMAGVLRFKRGAGGGAFVRESGSDGIEASIRAMLILGRLPIADLLDVRASLLAQCARLGAQRGTEADFDRLERIVDELDAKVSASQDHLVAIGPATDFYRFAARSTHNPLMVLLVDAIANLVAEMLATLRHRPRRDSVVARREMVAAMREGRADDAARVIRLHPPRCWV